MINNFNATQKIQKYSESQEFNEMIKRNVESLREKLLSENQEMRNVLITFQNEINALVREKKEELVSAAYLVLQRKTPYLWFNQYGSKD